MEALVNSILPVDMAGYFISDGEGSDLQIGKDALLSIGRSVRDILGFNVAEKALEDAAKLTKEIVSQLREVQVDEKLVALEETLSFQRDQQVRKRKKLAEDTEVLSQYQADFELVEQDLKSIDLDEVKSLTDQRDALLRTIARQKRERRDLQEERISLIRTYSWVAFAQRFQDEALDFIDEAEFKGKLPAPFNIQLVTDILEEESCICGAPIHDGSDAFLKIQALLQEASNPDIINRVHRARGRLIAIKTLSDTALQQLKKNIEKRAELDEVLHINKRTLDDYSIKISRIDHSKVSDLEARRKLLLTKIDGSKKDIWRGEADINELDDAIRSGAGDMGRLEALAPQAKKLFLKKKLLEKTQDLIKNELEKVEESIYTSLKEKIDDFLKKYLRQDYSIKITSGLKIGLVSSNGNIVPTSGGQSAILSFIYISSLVALAREATSKRNAILQPGAIAPLVYDAPFSSLDRVYALNVARELPNLVDQLIVLMYQDSDKDIAGELQKSGPTWKSLLPQCQYICGPGREAC